MTLSYHRAVQNFRYQARQILFKHLNRGSQRESCNGKQFEWYYPKHEFTMHFIESKALQQNQGKWV